jgi:O-antigen/teichoic acid export membrane protein
MLVRHIIGYAPSQLITAFMSFAALFCYTRLLTPEEFGNYALIVISMNALATIFFFWLQTSLPRLMPQAIKDGRAQEFRATTYVAYAAVSSILIIMDALAIAFLPLGDYYLVAWLAVPLCLARSFLTMNEAFHRSYLNFNRYNVIECGQAIFGLILGLGLVYFGHMGSTGAIIGMITGMALMLLVDLRTMLTTPLNKCRRDMFKDIARYGTPLVASFGLSYVVSQSDRYFIKHYQGLAAVGIYSAGYSLMDRITTNLFMLVATPAFPLTMYRYEHEGAEGARDQMYKNGVALLMIALPATAGLFLTNVQLATVFLGPEFREGAIKVMPWIAIGSIMNGFITHYFSYSFHITKKPLLLLFTQGPGAFLNLAMNIMLIPRLGYVGAAYSMVGCYVLMLSLNIWLGHRTFPINFPFKPALQIAGAVAIFVIVLKIIPFSNDLVGLVSEATLGGIIYAAGILAFNVMDARERAMRLCNKVLKRS